VQDYETDATGLEAVKRGDEGGEPGKTVGAIRNGRASNADAWAGAFHGKDVFFPECYGFVNAHISLVCDVGLVEAPENCQPFDMRNS